MAKSFIIRDEAVRAWYDCPDRDATPFSCFHEYTANGYRTVDGDDRPSPQGTVFSVLTLHERANDGSCGDCVSIADVYADGNGYVESFTIRP